jgi:hypothetical protein
VISASRTSLNHSGVSSSASFGIVVMRDDNLDIDVAVNS